MISSTSLFLVVHLIGIALGLGSATVKLVLLLKCRGDITFTSSYLKVARPITRLIILGLILTALSGIGWLYQGYPFSAHLIAKLLLVAAILVLGPIIDNVAEPKFRKLAPENGESASLEFTKARQLYLTLEIAATGLFYVIVAMWVLI